MMPIRADLAIEKGSLLQVRGCGKFSSHFHIVRYTRLVQYGIRHT